MERLMGDGGGWEEEDASRNSRERLGREREKWDDDNDN
jgi:hypothetical protein